MSNRLPILQSTIRDLYKKALLFSLTSADCALKVGVSLNEAKALCAHGKWNEWLDSAEIPARTAQRYMKLARAGCKSAIVADLGVVEAECLASLGLQLWPSESRGCEYAVLDAAAMAYCIIAARDDGRAEYFFTRLFENPADDFWCGMAITSPIALGVLHDSLTAGISQSLKHHMSAKQTRDAVTFIEEFARAA